MKDIVIIANFCRDFSVSDNGRFMYIAKMLSAENDVEIITSGFDHIAKRRRDGLKTEWPFRITFIDEPGYSRNISLRRFGSHFVWGRNVVRYLEKRKKPDAVYCAVPSISGPLRAARYCEKNGVRFIADIQDLWPEAFGMVFHVPVLSRLVFAPFRMAADGIYRRADHIIGVSRTYVERGLSVNSRGAQGTEVFLGTELAAFRRNAAENQGAAEEAGLGCKKEGELWLAYCGSLGDSYDISCVLDALADMRAAGARVPKFIVMGTGYRQEIFRKHAEEKNVEAVFTGKLPYERMCGILAMCDLAVNPIRGRSAASIINKHADYAAAGLPVVNNQDSSEYRSLIDEYGMGLNCKNGDHADMAQKLRMITEDAALRESMARGAERCAAERFDREHTYLKIKAVAEGRG